MRVALVVPGRADGVTGGAERVWRGLMDALAAQGHEARLVTETVDESALAPLLHGYLRFAALDLDDADAVISTKYPAWAVRHRHHVRYVQHPLRGLFDLYPADWPSGPDDDHRRHLVDAVAAAGDRDDFRTAVTRVLDHLRSLPPDHPDGRIPGPFARAVVHAADRWSQRGLARQAAISATVARRPDWFVDGTTPVVAHHPTSLRPVPPVSRRAGLFTSSRLDEMKRVDLVMAAMAHVSADVPLVVAGDGPERARLEAMAADDDRISLVGWVDDAELATGYASAVAVPFVPAAEDLGLVTLEAWRQGTPVVTTTDSGGVAELVTDGVDGRVVEADAAAVGTALEELLADPHAAADLGDAGRVTAERITWPGVIRRLLPPGRDPVPAPVRRGRARPRIAVISSTPVHTPRNGGELRIRQLAAGLGRHGDVEILSLGPAGAVARRHHIAGDVVERVVPRTAAHATEERAWADRVGVPVTDVLAAELSVAHTPAFVVGVEAALAECDVAVVTRPYLWPLVEAAAAGRPCHVDAHDVEIVQKGSALPATPDGEVILDRVRRLEGTAMAGAATVSATSDADADALAGHYGGPRPTVVPNGVDTASLPFTALGRRHARGVAWLRAATGAERVAAPGPVVFFGSWHPPNLEAARAVEGLARSRPDLPFLVAGGAAAALDGGDEPPACHHLPAVGSAVRLALLGTAAIGVNPARTGSGTSLKVPEWVACGLPVITTPFGARGFDDLHDVMTVVEIGRFGEEIDRILATPTETDARTRRGRRLVEAHHDWSHSVSALVDLLAL